MIRIRTAIQVSVVAVVFGCGDPDLSDLESLVADAPPATPDVLPAWTDRGAVGFQYGAMTARSPFEPFVDARATGATQAPDLERARHPQELFPLGQLEMVGTLAGRGRMRALIRDPHGTTHLLAIGDYLGRNHGRIATVRDTGIDIVEVVEDGRGGWMSRPRVLELSVPDQAGDTAPAFPIDPDDGGVDE